MRRDDDFPVDQSRYTQSTTYPVCLLDSVWCLAKLRAFYIFRDRPLAERVVKLPRCRFQVAC